MHSVLVHRLGLLGVTMGWPDVEILVYCDAGWASGPSQKSTTGGVLAVNGCLLLTWSRTQNTISLSSAEAELVSMSMGAQEAKGVANLIKDLGGRPHIRVLTDSSAALAMTQRLGPGRVKHLDLKMLWLQRERQEGVLDFQKISTRENIADLLTKALPGPRFRQLQCDVGVAMTEMDVMNCGLRHLALREQDVVAMITEGPQWPEPSWPASWVDDVSSAGPSAETWLGLALRGLYTVLVMLGVHQLVGGVYSCCRRRGSRTVAVR
jgi:hypothetical protein